MSNPEIKGIRKKTAAVYPAWWLYDCKADFEGVPTETRAAIMQEIIQNGWILNEEKKIKTGTYPRPGSSLEKPQDS